MNTMTTRSVGGARTKTNTSSRQGTTTKARDTEETLKKRVDILGKKINQELAAAKLHGAKRNQKMALQALERKKKYERQLQETKDAIRSIELQKNALESSTSNEKAEGIKDTKTYMDINKLQEFIEEEEKEEEREKESEQFYPLHEMLRFGQAFNPNDLLEELQEIEQAEADKKRQNDQSVPTSGPIAEQGRASNRAVGGIKDDSGKKNALPAWAKRTNRPK